MAQKARKDRAKANEASLKALHIGSAAVNIFFIIWCFILPFTAKRSVIAYILLSIPAAVAQYILETTGRPRYVDGQMKGSGEDLAAPGLTEYLFDIVWVTWASLISVVLFGNWGWLLFVSWLALSLSMYIELIVAFRRLYRFLVSIRDGVYWVWHEDWPEAQMEQLWSSNNSQWLEIENKEDKRHNFRLTIYHSSTKLFKHTSPRNRQLAPRITNSAQLSFTMTTIVYTSPRSP